ncbi:response regulator [Proteiniclasticum sp. C24MP]|uniref:response regulator n=1 Tax=Proteiniclasticum sp. C24MP TaxID=3374101 RepID=UPI00375442DC
MYKIIIADDKMQEREYLRTFIEENYKWDLTIMKVAHDGEEVLSLMKEEEPDLLLLDIQMPKIDGLEVAAQVSRTHPHVKVVLITAFAEFSYAKEAIKLGVSDYLLKPYTDHELKEVLNQVMLSLDTGRKEVLKEGRGRRNYNVGDFQEKSIISKILLKNVDSRFFEKHLMGLFSHELRYKCVVLYEENLTTEEVETMDVVRGFFQKKNLTILADLEGKEKVLFLFGEKTLDFNELENSIRRTRKFFKDGFGEEVYVGVSGFHEELGDLTRAYNDAVSFITEFGTSTVKTSYEENRKYDLALTNSESSIKLHVLNKSEEDALEGLDFLLEEVLSRRPEVYRERRLLYLSYGLIRSVYDVLGREEEGREKFLAFLEKKEIQDGNLQEKTEEVKALMTELIDTLGGLSVYNNVTLVKDAKSYIHGHFREKLTLSDVAEAVGISYGHLSKCFKQVEGNSFNSYLMEVRIEEAKRLMREENLPISEIAYEVGIGDPNYFSKCFKKQTGLSPKEYVTMTITGDV